MMKIRLYIISMLTLTFLAASAYAETLKVITKENAIREECRFFSPVRIKVYYNDTVEAVSKEGDWFKVKYKGIKGCIHKSAVEEKTFRLTGLLGSQSKTASEDEVSLAGKGFNPQVENSYKDRHPELDFRVVDSIGEYRISEESLRNFIKNGELNLP
ncbi:MAG: hypothetical protein HY755_07080 [Nitrospirae bacterium]|nr:hypothetical protein [Nitrospirota bacterium]